MVDPWPDDRLYHWSVDLLPYIVDQYGCWNYSACLLMSSRGARANFVDSPHDSRPLDEIARWDQRTGSSVDQHLQGVPLACYEPNDSCLTVMWGVAERVLGHTVLKRSRVALNVDGIVLQVLEAVERHGWTRPSPGPHDVKVASLVTEGTGCCSLE